MNKPGRHSGVARAIANLSDIVEQTFHYESTIYDLTQKVRKNKLEIKKGLGKKDSLTVRTEEDSDFLVSRDTDVSLEFFADKLQKALDKDTFKKIVNKRVIIDDLDGLIALMKDNGISPKQFKKYISTEHEVDMDKVDHLIDTEEISIEDIHGCYKADFNEEIKIRKIK